MFKIGDKIYLGVFGTSGDPCKCCRDYFLRCNSIDEFEVQKEGKKGCFVVSKKGIKLTADISVMHKSRAEAEDALHLGSDTCDACREYNARVEKKYQIALRMLAECPSCPSESRCGHESTSCTKYFDENIERRL